jgi:hypothetical protein
MKNLFILSIFILIFSCNYKSESKLTNREILHIKEFSNKLFKFDFSYTKNSINPEIIKCKKIIIRDINNGLEIQVIKIDTIEINRNSIFFSMDKDVNFDGYNDICYLNYVGAYTSLYSFWLYDKKNNNFKHYKGLDEIQNPIIIKEKNEICSFWHSGVSVFYLERYFWHNKSLILKEKYEESVTDKISLTTTKFVNNKYIVKNSTIKNNVVMFMKCK